MPAQSQRPERAASVLAAHGSKRRSVDVVDGLVAGLTTLRDLLVSRLHVDVERQFGVDSMVAPLSLSHEARQLIRASDETDAFAAAVVEDEVTRGGYVEQPAEWFFEWIFGLLLGESPRIRQDQAEPYRALTDKGRHLRLVTALQQAVPDSVRTPPVLFLLFPLGVRIAAAMAFGDSRRAQELRLEQAELLPSIVDCHECRGRLLGNDERCRNCGNPLWTFAFLRAV
jgi:hypothetical protein